MGQLKNHMIWIDENTETYHESFEISSNIEPISIQLPPGWQLAATKADAPLSKSEVIKHLASKLKTNRPASGWDAWLPTFSVSNNKKKCDHRWYVYGIMSGKQACKLCDEDHPDNLKEIL